MFHICEFASFESVNRYTHRFKSNFKPENKITHKMYWQYFLNKTSSKQEVLTIFSEFKYDLNFSMKEIDRFLIPWFSENF